MGSRLHDNIAISPFYTFVYSRFFNFNILHSFNNKPRVSLYATPLTTPN